MHMLYNSDSFTVVALDIPVPADAAPDAPSRGGFEILDKFAKTDIFIQGEMAERFKAGALELMAGRPSEEEIDDYIGGFTSLMPQPLVLH